MKTRLFNNWLTSLFGVGILVLAFYLKCTNKIDTTEFGTMLVLALTYLRAKDSLIPGVEAKK